VGVHSKFLLGAALSSFLIAPAQAQEVQTGEALMCATAADAKDYAAAHEDKPQAAIESVTDAKACRVAKIAYVPGKQTERLQLKDATYIVTEILVVAVGTPYGYLSMRPPNIAYTLLKLKEEAV
jgi:hypothetical protein